MARPPYNIPSLLSLCLSVVFSPTRYSQSLWWTRFFFRMLYRYLYVRFVWNRRKWNHNIRHFLSFPLIFSYFGLINSLVQVPVAGILGTALTNVFDWRWWEEGVFWNFVSRWNSFGWIVWLEDGIWCVFVGYTGWGFEVSFFSLSRDGSDWRKGIM